MQCSVLEIRTIPDWYGDWKAGVVDWSPLGPESTDSFDETQNTFSVSSHDPPPAAEAKCIAINHSPSGLTMISFRSSWNHWGHFWQDTRHEDDEDVPPTFSIVGVTNELAAIKAQVQTTLSAISQRCSSGEEWGCNRPWTRRRRRRSQRRCRGNEIRTILVVAPLLSSVLNLTWISCLGSLFDNRFSTTWMVWCQTQFFWQIFLYDQRIVSRQYCVLYSDWLVGGNSTEFWGIRTYKNKLH